MSHHLVLLPPGLEKPACGIRTDAPDEVQEQVAIRQVVGGSDRRKAVFRSQVILAPNDDEDDLTLTFTIRDAQWERGEDGPQTLSGLVDQWGSGCVACALHLLRATDIEKAGVVVLPETITDEQAAALPWSGGWVQHADADSKKWVEEPDVMFVGDLLLWDWFTEQKSEALGPHVSEDKIARGGTKAVALLTHAGTTGAVTLSRYEVESHPEGMSLRRDEEPVIIEGDPEDIDGVWDLLIDAREMTEAGVVEVPDAGAISVTSGLVKYRRIADEDAEVDA